ncbi:MAG: septum formation initiator family protein [Ruminococcus sp.]|nr:septum formation initiator family protein [Ruminococcus sp.]
MAYGTYGTTDRGYDLSLFETQGTAARKTAPAKQTKKQPKAKVVKLPEHNFDKAQRRKHNFASLAVGAVVMLVIVAIVGVIIHGYAQVSELNEQIAEAQIVLEHRQSEYIQMSAKVEASLSTAAVEEYARTQLGMTKATNQQKEYISLSQGDKAVVYSDTESNVFTEIGDFFESLWS